MTGRTPWADYKVISLSETERDYHVYVEQLSHPTHCLFCNLAQLVKYGRREEKIIDAPFNRKRTQMILDRYRYRCKACGKTFLEPIADKDQNHQMTKRLIQYIKDKSQFQSFASIAKEIGSNENTVRIVANRQG